MNIKKDMTLEELGAILDNFCSRLGLMEEALEYIDEKPIPYRSQESDIESDCNIPNESS